MKQCYFKEVIKNLLLSLKYSLWGVAGNLPFKKYGGIIALKFLMYCFTLLLSL